MAGIDGRRVAGFLKYSWKIPRPIRALRPAAALTETIPLGRTGGRAIAAMTSRRSSMKPTSPKGPDTPLSLSRSEAVAAILVGCVAVDGVLKDEESSRLNATLSSTRWVVGSGGEPTAGIRTRALSLINAYGLPAVIAASATAIPAELRATVFALALDLILADGRLDSRENALMDQLQGGLRIENNLARKIIEVLLIKNRASGRPDL